MKSISKLAKSIKSVAVFTILVAVSLWYQTGFAQQWQGSQNNSIYRFGRIGIGTNNPVSKLHIYSPGSSDAFKITNPAVSKSARMDVDQYRVFIEPSEHNSTIRLNANPSWASLIVRGDNGNIGINTYGPTARLHIYSPGSSDALNPSLPSWALNQGENGNINSKTIAKFNICVYRCDCSAHRLWHTHY